MKAALLKITLGTVVLLISPAQGQPKLNCRPFTKIVEQTEGLVIKEGTRFISQPSQQPGFTKRYELFGRIIAHGSVHPGSPDAFLHAYFEESETEVRRIAFNIHLAKRDGPEISLGSVVLRGEEEFRIELANIPNLHIKSGSFQSIEIICAFKAP